MVRLHVVVDVSGSNFAWGSVARAIAGVKLVRCGMRVQGASIHTVPQRCHDRYECCIECVTVIVEACRVDIETPYCSAG